MMIIDTMPPAAEDYWLDSSCRIRAYTPPGGRRAVIVATDLDKHATAPAQNIVGNVFRLAFRNAGEPTGTICL